MARGLGFWGRWTWRLFLLVVVLLVAGAGFVYWQLSGSLAQLDGEVRNEGLSAPVLVKRDARGVPRITAEERTDSAFALGYLHAQERFFQMDLLRRNSAGELSALFGDVALNHDRAIRRHQFRQRGQAAYAALPDAHRQILDQYVQGVNQGLGDLRSQPFEHLVLGLAPQAWSQEDTFLTLYSMYLDLQPDWAEQEISRGVMRDLLPADWFDFLQPEAGEWDAPIHGEAGEFSAPIPDAPLAEFVQAQRSGYSPADNPLEKLYAYTDPISYGSNNWSVGGNLTNYGAAMVANDMHLGHSVPNIWYQATWNIPGQDREISGATLPGAPAMVVGSNQQIAWGFTNSNGDYQDVVILQTRNDDSEYLTPEGWQSIEFVTEVIDVAGEEPFETTVRRTQWGPVIGRNHEGYLMAMRWVAHDTEGANLNLLALEDAMSVEDALPIAQQTGVPGQNFVVVDRDGQQAWTIMGRLPERSGDFDGQEPRDWSDGEFGWAGYLAPEDYPVVRADADGRLWTANARIVSDELLDLVGQGNYALGARQQQIRDVLLAEDRFDEQDLLALQLDDRALFLQRWRDLLLDVLADAETDDLVEMRSLVENWAARAAAEDVGYHIVKRFRESVIDGTVGEVYRQLQVAAGNTFRPGWIDNRAEYPVWALLQERPEQHIPAPHDSWDAFLLARAALTLEVLTADGGALAEQTWGSANTLDIAHPMASGIPLLGRFLRMPAEPMNGDTFLPLAQGRTWGASQRMVVTPGEEQNAIFHMATGQSGHPLSPFFDHGHRDWVEGRPAPLLSGDVVHQLHFLPGEAD